MGSKKKKRGGGRGKGRTRSGDHISHVTDSNELFAEELTALFAIFQEDCKLVSESPPQIVIKLRPYLKDVGCEDPDVAALLSVRCLPGYPYKCPRVQITPEKGLSRVDADNLLSLLQDQVDVFWLPLFKVFRPFGWNLSWTLVRFDQKLHHQSSSSSPQIEAFGITGSVKRSFWVLWKERNNRIFENLETLVQ